MAQPELEFHELSLILAEIDIPRFLGKGPKWRIGVDGTAFYIQLTFWAPDESDTTERLKEQHCRKWRVSRFSTKTEIVETAFKACWIATFHEMSEQFRYKGQPIYSPHFDVDARVEMCQSARFDKRED